jgi:hypothetical protein
MGIISSVASIFGYDPLKKAEKKARGELQRGQNDALGYYAPYDGVSQNALAAFSNAIGAGDSEAGIEAFKNSPLYRLNYDNMVKAGGDAITGSSQAGGTYNSGRTLQALSENAGRVTSGLYDRYINPLADFNVQGERIAGNKANIRTGFANQLADSRRNTGAIGAGNLAGFDKLLDNAMKAAGGYMG